MYMIAVNNENRHVNNSFKHLFPFDNVSEEISLKMVNNTKGPKKYKSKQKGKVSE